MKLLRHIDPDGSALRKRHRLKRLYYVRVSLSSLGALLSFNYNINIIGMYYATCFILLLPTCRALINCGIWMAMIN